MASCDDNWPYEGDIKGNAMNSNARVLEVLHEFSRLFRANKLDCNNYFPNIEEDLKSLKEQNTHLRKEIEKTMEELSEQKKTYDTFKKDQNLLSKEVQETYKNFITCKQYFRKYLNMYYTIESQEGDTKVIFLQFFTRVKIESKNYCIRLLRDSKTGRFELIETIPKLQGTEDLNKYLKETNNVPEVLCSIRQAFIKMKSENS